MSYGNDIFDANSIYKINTLSSGGDEWIINEVGKNKAAPYIFPVKELKKSNVQMLFLGPAWDDWSMYTNAAYASLSGMYLRPDEERVARASPEQRVAGGCLDVRPVRGESGQTHSAKA